MLTAEEMDERVRDLAGRAEKDDRDARRRLRLVRMLADPDVEFTIEELQEINESLDAGVLPRISGRARRSVKPPISQQK